jgi:hypothetical protein
MRPAVDTSPRSKLLANLANTKEPQPTSSELDRTTKAAVAKKISMAIHPSPGLLISRLFLAIRNPMARVLLVVSHNPLVKESSKTTIEAPDTSHSRACLRTVNCPMANSAIDMYKGK